MAYNANVVEASDLGLAAWSLDPAACIVSIALATTVQYLAAVYFKPDSAVAPRPSKVIIPNGVVGTSTIFQCAVINMDQLEGFAPGTVLATTPAASTISAGLNALTLTWIAGVPANLPAGRYWIGIMNTTGTTTTMLASSNPGTSAALGINAGPGADVTHCRFGIAVGTGVFTPGGLITVASNVITNAAGLCLCAALA